MDGLHDVAEKACRLGKTTTIFAYYNRSPRFVFCAQGTFLLPVPRCSTVPLTRRAGGRLKGQPQDGPLPARSFRGFGLPLGLPPVFGTRLALAPRAIPMFL